MVTCPACSHENADGQKFCGECGTRLDRAVRAIEERKVVTALFCDLVGFTSISESADPEDVDKMLGAYFEMARSAIDAFGGTVEKFIGDAVVGVFGVPAAHEDDPERAVRAGLRLTEEAEQLNGMGTAPLRLRVGINTGEALVLLGVATGSGEGFLRGDAINTASRIQSVAPEMGVAVGLATYEATAPVFEYEELEPAALKGKSQPVRIFHAKASRARFGTDLTRSPDTPFVGREIDLALLKGIFDKTVAANSVQFVTVVGEPGLGKTRIVGELAAYLDTRNEMITWRQGRCLPYGEGVTFWALGEIVKAHAGVLESDPPAEAEAKLDAVLPEGDERAWFRQRLLPLVGIEAASQAERDELFTAWRRFLEHLAEERPTVLVFEDLHWADDAMLAFLEHLADRAEWVPLLVIGTARPELFEHHASYAAGLRNVNQVNLAPLSDEETGRLVSSLLDTTAIPVELQRAILDRVEGNPLYAEEFVRLLKDKGLLSKRGSTWALREGVDVPFPDSVQALIAARLDALDPGTKSILADAAVVGKVFWAGAVAEMSGIEVDAVAEVLRDLSRKELVRASRRSSMDGESEYSFWHVLTRDVAYAQLPRAARAARHANAAAWIEAKAGDRVEDLADVLAHHYVTALDLATAAGDLEQARRLEARARRFLILAGDRALGLDAAAALTSFERALALTPPGHTDRPDVLARFGQAAMDRGRSAEAAAALEEAIAAFRRRGDVPAAARSMFMLVQVALVLGEARTFEIGDEALELLEPLPPGPELVGALVEVSRSRVLDGQSAAGVAYAERALGLAETLGIPAPPRALGYRGLSRCELGDPGGLADMRSALTSALESGESREAGSLYNNLGRCLWGFEGPKAAIEMLRQGIEFDEARGLTSLSLWISASSLDALLDLGDLDACERAALQVDERAERAGVVPSIITSRAARARVYALQGREAEAAGFLDWLETASRDTGAPEIVAQGLGSSGIARAALGQRDEAAALLEELAGVIEARAQWASFAWLPSFVRAARGIGDLDLARRLADVPQSPLPYAAHAAAAAQSIILESDGECEKAAEAYAQAADRWADFGVVPEHAFALLGQGRCLALQGRPDAATPVLLHARGLFEQLGARPALAETDALIGGSSPSSAGQR